MSGHKGLQGDLITDLSADFTSGGETTTETGAWSSDAGQRLEKRLRSDKGSEQAKEKALDRFQDKYGDEVTLTFDDVVAEGDADGTVLIESGYSGLEWGNVYALDVDIFEGQSSGFVNGAVSGDGVAYNGFSDTGLVSDGSSDFDLVSGYFTAAWNDGLILDIYAYDDGVQVGQATLELNTQEPLFYEFGIDFASVDQIVFESSGGVDAGLDGDGAHFLMDDLTMVFYDEMLV